MLDTWINFAEGFVLVYSIDDRESFESLKDKYDVSGFVGEDGTTCDTKKSGIYFDPDKKLGLNYEKRDPITPILIGCSKDQR